MQPCKTFLFAGTFFLSASLLTPQSSSVPAMPSMPSMPTSPTVPSMSSMPSMPSISTPSKNNNFYTPGNTQNTNANTTTNQNNSFISKSSQTSNENKNIIEQNVKSKTQSLLNSVSASDLETLSNQGLLGNITSLFNTNSETQNPLDSNTQTLLLQKILIELNEIKAEQKSLTNQITKIKNETKDSPIIRFVINNQDILNNCTSIFFTNRQADGSFLLTGDHKFIAEDNSPQNETFYLLFKTSGTSESKIIYKVSAAISQSTINTETPLYQFCNKTNLQATKTGNLVSLKILQGALSSDMLLDLGKNSSVISFAKTN